jgi:DNA-binding GntR family transcriptional regulator
MMSDNGKLTDNSLLVPLDEPVQRACRVYTVLLQAILRGELTPDSQIHADGIAERLKVSTTPVRDALNRLEKDGLIVKYPYQGWFVRSFSEREIRDLYEMRAGLESFGVGLACERITTEEIEELRRQQSIGVEALERGAMEEYRIYNQDLHSAITKASRNAELLQFVEQITRQTQMLTAQSIRVAGRPSRAVREHEQLIEFIAKRDSARAQELMKRHILSALKDLLATRRA